MNRKLRNRHRVMWTGLAVIVPLLFIAGLAVRPSTPLNDELPSVRPSATEFPVLVASAGAHSGYAEFAWELRRSDTDPSRQAIALEPWAPSISPGADALLYWSRNNPDNGAWPAGETYLLGALAGPQKRLFELPPAAAGGNGYLVIYSMTANRVLGPSLPVESLR